MKSIAEHWDHLFSNTKDTKLGWYEKNSSQILKLLTAIPDWEKTTIFLPGVGTSLLVEDLISKGTKLVLNDISIDALNKLKQRLKGKTEHIVWVCQDIARRIQQPLPEITIWIDRAVLHFLTNESDINGYFENLKSLLKPGGHAIFAEYSVTGASKCAGLEVHRYTIIELTTKLGPAFKLVYTFDYTYVNPFTEQRPYIYALFKREK